MSTINTAELRAVLTEIEAHPETWDQTMWARRTKCGTTFCFAGHVVARSPHYDIVWGANGQTGLCRDKRGRKEIPIPVAAQHILGLNDDQAAALFRGGNDLDDLRRIVESVCAKAEAR